MCLKSIFNFEKIFMLSKWYCLDLLFKAAKRKKNAKKWNLILTKKLCLYKVKLSILYKKKNSAYFDNIIII